MNEEDNKLVAIMADQTAGEEEETAGVEDNDGLLGDTGSDDDTSGNDDDTSGDDEDTGAVKKVKRALALVDRSKVSAAGYQAAVAIAKRNNKKGKKAVRRGTAKAPLHIANARREALDEWRGTWPGEKVTVTKGFIFGSMFIEFRGVGTPDYGLLVCKKDSGGGCFDKYIGDTVTLFQDTGQPVIVTLTESETNLAKIAANAYPKQKVLLERVSTAVRAIRMKYAEADVNAAVGLNDDWKNMLRGQSPIFDEDGLAVPQGLFHDFSGRLELYRAFAANGVLKVITQLTKVGSNKSTEEFVLDTLINLRDVGREPSMSLLPTSGGALLPFMNKGILINLDQSDPKAMQFQAGVDMKRDFHFAFKPVKANNTANAIHPERVSVQVELRFEVTSFQPTSEVKRRGR